MTLICGLNVNMGFGSDQLRAAGTQKCKSSSPIHGLELCLTEQLHKEVTLPADSPPGFCTWLCRSCVDVKH